jgi:hypothetical protein
MKKIYVLMIAICFVIAFSAVDLFAQKSGKGRYVTLKRNERKNSYKTVSENGEIIFEAENVEDPSDGAFLRGKKKLEYRCELGQIPFVKELLFSNGRSNRQQVECLMLITPRIIIQEEEN